MLLEYLGNGRSRRIILTTTLALDNMQCKEQVLKESELMWFLNVSLQKFVFHLAVVVGSIENIVRLVVSLFHFGLDLREILEFEIVQLEIKALVFVVMFDFPEFNGFIFAYFNGKNQQIFFSFEF